MSHRRTSGCLAGLLTVTWLCLQVVVAHAEPSATDRDTARKLLFDGRKQLAAKAYQEALKSLAAAHAIMGVPTTGIELARAQQALGMLVEARETALSVTRMPVAVNESPIFVKARESAAELAAAIEPKIPSVSIVVTGPPGGVELVVRLDGRVVEPASLGLPRSLNAGHHSIEVEAVGFVAEKRAFDVTEAEKRTETIALRPEPPSQPKPTAVGLPSATASSAGVGSSATIGSSPTPVARAIPVWTWVSGATGLAAAGVSIGFLVDYLDAKNTVERECPKDVCVGRSQVFADGLRDRWNVDLGVTIGVGAVSIGAIAAAIVGIAARPASDRTTARVRVLPWVGPATGGLTITAVY